MSLFRRVTRRQLLSSRMLLLFSILGPGIITANADNDASGIYGYSLAGAQYKYGMLWILVLSTFALGVAQEICARMGAVTGRGLADLIREEYGVKITFVAMIALLVANYFTTVSEFAGILAATQILGPTVARFLILPLVAFGIWFVVTRGSYRGVERTLLLLSFVYLFYVVSAFLAPHVDWGMVFHDAVLPDLRHVGPMKPYVFMIINVIGTTITPWGQFYVQSSVRDKGINAEDYGYTRIDVLFGAFFTNLVAFFIVVCCGATLAGRVDPSQLNDAGQVARALEPVAGKLATALFAIGLFNASCFGAVAVPLSTAYAVTEALGWESGVGRRTREAPLFIGVFTFLLAASTLLVMAFPHNLVSLIILPNIVGAVLLPIILVLMLLLVNKKRLMGHYTNSRLYNGIAWGSTAVLIGLSVALLVTRFL